MEIVDAKEGSESERGDMGSSDIVGNRIAEAERFMCQSAVTCKVVWDGNHR